jgi:pyridoxal phosphate enzyme (YggS family)
VGEQERRAELAGNLDRLRERIAAACRAAGRDPAEVTLVAVTKTRPASDTRLLAELGVTDVGENRAQDAAAKHAACADLTLRWHFVGQLQTNKARAVAEFADVVHSVDRPALVAALRAAARRADREIDCLIQVDLDDAPAAGDMPGTARGGCPPAEVPALAAELAAAAPLRLAGLMAVAPLSTRGRPERARAAFDRLAACAAAVRAAYPDAHLLSAGMSADLEPAIAAGATHVRVGTALLGIRPALR